MRVQVQPLPSRLTNSQADPLLGLLRSAEVCHSPYDLPANHFWTAIVNGSIARERTAEGPREET